MTETGPTGSQDRMVGLEAVDGFAFENDGTPISELDVDAPDSLLDRGETVAEQAIGERSWRFGHVIVDEAQDLTPMQWRMIARRSHGGGITLVGDLAQRSIGQPGEWADHLPAEFQGFAQAELTINYRAPAEINDLASAVLAELAPELTASRSIRSVGVRPTVERLGDLDGELSVYLQRRRAARPGGRLAVIGFGLSGQPSQSGAGVSIGDAVPGTVILDPWQAKGLEFDSVVLVEPARFLDEQHGLSLLYVALTRTTDELAIVHRRPLPPVLAAALGG